MNIRELSVGNYFLWGNTEHIMEEQDYMNMYVNGMDSVTGIPLTKQWLIDFGFKSIRNTFYIDNIGVIWDINKQWQYVIKEKQEASDMAVITFHILREIKYVHQIQNIYFAFKDKELTKG